jgi:signal transduction histidine kinase
MIVGAREDTGMGISDDVKPRLFQPSLHNAV